MVKQGSRGYQKARYRDNVRPAVNVYNTPCYKKPPGRGKGWGTSGAMTGDLIALAKAIRATGRGFTYARASATRLYVVPVFPVL